MEKEENCIECGFKLRGVYKQIGIVAETGEYTLDDTKATQGFFSIGIYCFNKVKELIKKNKEVKPNSSQH